MNLSAPLWLDALTAALVVVGALAALIGSFGLLRLPHFFQRVHAPTLGATVGIWSLTLAMVAQLSYVGGQPYVHAVLVGTFIALTAPVTTVLLMRAALFRARQRGEPDVPLTTDGAPSAPDRAAPGARNRAAETTRSEP
jgi:multicomponent K+:H+ antiporter subunit G